MRLLRFESIPGSIATRIWSLFIYRRLSNWVVASRADGTGIQPIVNTGAMAEVAAAQLPHLLGCKDGEQANRTY